MRVSINWRFLLICGVLLGVALAALHFTHRWQVRSQTGAYLRQADAARDATDAEKELRYLQRYLLAHPNDLDTRERVVRLMAKSATTGKQKQAAYLALDDVLRRDPGRDDLRRFTLDFAINTLGNAKEGLVHIEVLLGKTPADADLLFNKGRCLATQRKFDVAEGAYKQAYEAKPDLLAAYAQRAFILLSKQSNPDEADKAIEQMVANNPAAAAARLQEAVYWRQREKPVRSKEAIAKARKLAPDDLDVILGTAESLLDDARTARRAGDRPAADAKYADARAELDRGAKLHPNQAAVSLTRAVLENDAVGPAAAVKVLTDALAGRTWERAAEAALLVVQVEYQIQAGDADAAAAGLDRLEKLVPPSPRLAFQRAQVRVLREDWLAAAAALEKVRAEAVADPALVRQANLWLGRCYGPTGEPERQLDAFVRATPDDVTDLLYLQGTAGQAEALTRLGRTDEALRAYRKVADRFPGLWKRIARLELVKAAGVDDAAKRDWRPTEEAVAKAAQWQPDDVETILVRADLLAVTGKPADARKVIDDLLAARPKEPAAWTAKASLQFRTPADGPAAAVSTLEKGRAELGDPVELRLAQARFSANPADPDVAKKLTALADGADKYPPADRRRLVRGLAELATAAGADALAGDLWEQAAELQPYDLTVHLERFDRARRAGDAAAEEKVMADIRRVAGASGVATRFTRALHLLGRAEKGGDRAGLAEAVALLDGLEQDRPTWPRVPLAKAVALDTQGKPDDALKSYQRARELGDTSPTMLRRLSALLSAKGRYAEANDILTNLPESVGLSPDAQRLGAELALVTGSPKRAVEQAARAVPADSTNPADLLWHGRVLLAANDPKAAEKPARRAVELAPAEPDGWLLLIDCLVRTDRRPEAEKVVADARGRVKADAADLFAAMTATLLGRLDDARSAFATARAARPADAAVLTTEAEFLTAVRDWAAAREAWGRVAARPGATDAEQRGARRMTAVCLANDPDPATARRAAESLGPVADADGTDPEQAADRRARATVLGLQKDRASKLEAIRLYEGTKPAPSEADLFALAQLRNQVGDKSGVRTAMIELLRTRDRNPEYLSFYTVWLLEQGDARDAAGWAAKLAAVEPDTPRTIELLARAQAAAGKKEDAAAALRKLADRPNPPLGVLAAVAEEVGLIADAEGYLKRLIDANNKVPQAALLLAGFYARQGRLPDALAVCEAGWKTCPPVAVGQACVEVLSSIPTADPDAVKKVLGWLEAALAKSPADAPALVQQKAFVLNVQGKYDAAADAYRGLTVGPKPDPLALNNLAYLLSAHARRHDEALTLIEQAKRAVGPVPELLDTEALVRMGRGTKDDLATARRLLDDVVALAPSAAAYFHLAQLEKAEGNRLEASLAWKEAVRRKLKQADLHPLEWPAYRAMQAAVGPATGR